MDFKKVFLKGQKHIESHYENYLEEWKKCAGSFQQAMDIFFKEGICEEYSYWVENTHKIESHADDLRRKIEFDLYSKALLPESRGDILRLLEGIDKILNKFESVLYQILLEKIVIPEDLRQNLKRIIQITLDANDLVMKAAALIFDNLDEIITLADRIDQKESECDHAERTALEKLFTSEFDGYTKIMLKNLVIEMGNITDRIESVSDRLVIFSVKRRV